MLGRAGGEGELSNGQIPKKFFLPHLAHFGNGLRFAGENINGGGGTSAENLAVWRAVFNALL